MVSSNKKSDHHVGFYDLFILRGKGRGGGGLLLDPDGTLVHVKDHPKVGQVKELGRCGWPGVYRQITSLTSLHPSSRGCLRTGRLTQRMTSPFSDPSRGKGSPALLYIWSKYNL